MRTIVRDILITLAIALALFFVLRAALQAYQVKECCMEPNYVEGEWIMVSKASYWWGEPGRGDVIILDPPFDTDQVYIKRLIGLPGDTVEIKDGIVYLNGVALDEPYVNEAPTYTLPLRALGEDEYFVLGDNRNNANDSSKGWTIVRDDIIGKAWFSYWPTSELGWANNYDLDEQLEAAAEPTP
jgi:signal peptidase I